MLEAKYAAIARRKPGNHWNEPHDAAVRAITQGLVKLGLLKGKVPALIKEGAYRRFFMHRTGHWLGMDVHDVGDYKIGDEWRVLEPGMALTIEPGIYIPAGIEGRRRSAGGTSASASKTTWSSRATATKCSPPGCRRNRMPSRNWMNGTERAVMQPMLTSTSPSPAAAWSARASRWRWRSSASTSC